MFIARKQSATKMCQRRNRLKPEREKNQVKSIDLNVRAHVLYTRLSRLDWRGTFNSMLLL